MIRRTPKTERRAMVAAELRWAGYSHAEIGKALGLSRQRVQQLLRAPKPVALKVVTRAQSRCEVCRRRLRHGHIHHIYENGYELRNAPENLAYLCTACHTTQHQMQCH